MTAQYDLHPVWIQPGSEVGSLCAVIVDPGLDTKAWWLKTLHDLGNTGNAATALE